MGVPSERYEHLPGERYLTVFLSPQVRRQNVATIAVKALLARYWTCQPQVRQVFADVRAHNRAMIRFLQARLGAQSVSGPSNQQSPSPGTAKFHDGVCRFVLTPALVSGAAFELAPSARSSEGWWATPWVLAPPPGVT